MKIDFEYGQGTMTAELPDNTDIFIPGETVPDPDYIPEDKLEEAYLDSLECLPYQNWRTRELLLPLSCRTA